MEVDNLGSSSWVCVLFTGFKAHFCPRDLVGGLIADIESRDGETNKVEEVSEGAIDLPGIVMADRPWEVLEVCGLRLSIPSQDFEHFMAKLETAPERRFANGAKYHKIHGWLQCVVFTPEQRETALRAMNKMLPEARKRCDDADKEFLKRMDKVNEGRLRAVSWRECALRGNAPKDKN